MEFVQTPESVRFLDYWKSLRRPGEGLIPRRSDFSPAAIKSLLPYIFIVDIEQHDARFRLVGTAMTERAQRELTGLRYSQLSTPAQLENSLARANLAFSHPCGLYRHFEEKYGQDFACIVELTMLPLLSDGPLPKQTVCLAMPRNYDELSDVSHDRFKIAADRDYSVIDIGAGVPSLDVMPD